MDQAFVGRVLAYIDTQKQSTVPFSAVEAAEFAPGILAVQDTMKECDVYFDLVRWEAIDPKLWGNTLIPPYLQDTGIGVIPLGRGLQFSTAFEIVKRHLKPAAVWHERPEVVPLPQSTTT